MYHAAVLMNGVGNRVTHNLIHDAPHMAINFGGNDHLIEMNEIHDVCRESNDAGAIYGGRDWTMRGTKVRYNYFHHISGFEGRSCVGVYLDDQLSGIEIRGNLFYKVTRAAMIGGGRDCSIVNNVFVDCVPATHVDARGLNWAAFSRTRWRKRWPPCPIRTRYGPAVIRNWCTSSTRTPWRRWTISSPATFASAAGGAISKRWPSRWSRFKTICSTRIRGSSIPSITISN